MNIYNKNYNFILLEWYTFEEILPDFFSELPWDEISRDEHIDYIFDRYLDYWNIEILITNKFIKWDLHKISLFKDQLFGRIEWSNNLFLCDYLYFFKDKIEVPVRIRKELSVKKVELCTIDKYPQFFEFGINSESYSISRLKSNKHFFFRDANISFNSQISAGSSDIKFLQKFKQQLDFWSIALFWRLDIEVIEEFADCFDVIRPFSHYLQKDSDFGFNHKYSFRSGWENLLTNPYTPLDGKFFKLFGDKKIKNTNTLYERQLTWYFGSDQELDNYINEQEKSDFNWITVNDLSVKVLIGSRDYFGIRINTLE
ncbi:MAG: hypothetical protein P8O16_06555 [Algoriphagus sp.]|uniref:hypothetical protein n=1 Tax=Algoriphagus sp. TaxID=1872435 RepID=UPI002605B3E4|nr:hypothetical protein [Algoriphagus sp.]MDG1276926.1 hypothetical protein [Algoriphagus sp.]